MGDTKSQGCVLSPVLYTMYTNDCRSVDPSTMFVMFSDDTAMLALLTDFVSYQSYLSPVVHFSSTNFLYLNVSTPKEMCIDFRCNRTVICRIFIGCEPMKQVDSFKYLGVVLETKLSFTEHVTAVQKDLSSDCSIFESCELSTLNKNIFYGSTVAQLSLS